MRFVFGLSDFVAGGFAGEGGRFGRGRGDGVAFGLMELDADDLADAMVGHGDTVEDIGHTDRAFIVGDDDELGVFEEALEDTDEAVDVGFVEGGVELVEDAERAGFDLVDGEEE